MAITRLGKSGEVVKNPNSVFPLGMDYADLNPVNTMAEVNCRVGVVAGGRFSSGLTKIITPNLLFKMYRSSPMKNTYLLSKFPLESYLGAISSKVVKLPKNTVFKRRYGNAR